MQSSPSFYRFAYLQVERTYQSIVLRVPIGPKGIVETKIGRSSRDRKKMTALPLHTNRCAQQAPHEIWYSTVPLRISSLPQMRAIHHSQQLTHIDDPLIMSDVDGAAVIIGAGPPPPRLPVHPQSRACDLAPGLRGVCVPRSGMSCQELRFSRGRYSKSTFQLLEALPGNAAALVQWNLSTGRTHQIRVHAQVGAHSECSDCHMLVHDVSSLCGRTATKLCRQTVQR